MTEDTPATGNADARERARESERKYREANREEINARRRRSRGANPEPKREQDRRYRKENQDKLQAYREANRERKAELNREYRAANRDRIRKRRAGRQREYYQQAKLDPDFMQRQREAQRKYRTANRKTVRILERLRKHGLTPDGWSALWAAADGRCYLCQRELRPDEAVIEHDHRCCPEHTSCGACRRGFACGSCNAAIGFADDDPERLMLMAANLRTAIDAVAERMSARPVQGTLFSPGDAA